MSGMKISMYEHFALAATEHLEDPLTAEKYNKLTIAFTGVSNMVSSGLVATFLP
jgi:hexokinase